MQEVDVSLPVTHEIVDHEDFTGRMEAVKCIDIRGRVSGYLEKVLFREGFDVKEGDTLFLIDPRRTRPITTGRSPIWPKPRPTWSALKADFKGRHADPDQRLSQADYDLAMGDRNEAYGRWSAWPRRP